MTYKINFRDEKKKYLAIFFICLLVLFGFLSTKVELDKPDAGFYAKVFGGYLFVPGKHYISIADLKGKGFAAYPIRSEEYKPEESLTYIFGKGDEEELFNAVKFYLDKLELEIKYAHEYQGFTISEYGVSKETLFDEYLTVNYLVTISKDNQYMAIFGDYHKGSEDYYKDLLFSITKKMP